MPKPHKTLRSFSTGIHEEEPPVDCSERSALAPSLTPKQAYRGCLLCKQSHSLEFCKQFQKMTLNERKILLRKRGYCYGCMDGKHLSGHVIEGRNARLAVACIPRYCMKIVG